MCCLQYWIRFQNSPLVLYEKGSPSTYNNAGELLSSKMRGIWSSPHDSVDSHSTGVVNCKAYLPWVVLLCLILLNSVVLLAFYRCNVSFSIVFFMARLSCTWTAPAVPAGSKWSRRINTNMCRKSLMGHVTSLCSGHQRTWNCHRYPHQLTEKVLLSTSKQIPRLALEHSQALTPIGDISIFQQCIDLPYPGCNSWSQSFHSMKLKPNSFLAPFSTIICRMALASSHRPLTAYKLNRTA